MSIINIIENRGILEVVHFTTNRGLVGALAEGAFLSRRQLPKSEYLKEIAFPNAKFRPEESAFFDKSKDWLDYINLSISKINKYFYEISAGRWHASKDVWWAICAFDPLVMTHDGVFFGTTNNKYELCERGAGPEGLEALFKERIPRKRGWTAQRGKRHVSHPTCDQAEVLYPARLPIEQLRTVYVADANHSDLVRGWLREFEITGVKVKVDAAKFREG